jgi:FMN reductase
MRLVVIAGDRRPQSATLAVAAVAADVISQVTGLAGGYELIDLSALAPRLLQAAPCPVVEDAAEQAVTADLLLVASPTVKGSYSGLLKVFLDLLPQRALAGTVGLPLLVTDAPEHALAVDVYLRPLLVELGCLVPTPGLAVPAAGPGPLDSILYPWAAQVAKSLGAVFPAVPAEPRSRQCPPEPRSRSTRLKRVPGSRAGRHSVP